ncbi:T9SS type A sorting domain-containing protein [Labilibacter sediminis]|nr:T9SS type A sorting domain-containing protein [Labilibacter sediminis]
MQILILKITYQVMIKISCEFHVSNERNLNMKIYLFVTLCLFFVCLQLRSQELYVSPTGDDNNPGTISLPVKTLEKALEKVSAGVIYLLEGSYHESFELSNKKAQSENPIVIMAYPGDKVIFVGTQEVESSWQLDEGSIYKTTPGFAIWQLFEDGKMLNAARWPNIEGYIEDEQPVSAIPTPLSIWDQPGTWGASSESSTNGTMIDNGDMDLAGSIDFDLTDAVAILNVGSFKTTYAPITAHSIGGNSFNYDSSISDKFVTWQKPNLAYYYLEGKREMLDHPGEWFYDTDNGELFLYTKDGQSPEGKKIEGKVQSYVVSMSSCTNIIFKDIYFWGTTIQAVDCKYLTVENCHFTYPSHSKRMLREFGKNIDVTLFTGKNVSEHITIRNNIFEYTEGEALVMHGHNHLIENNLFRHIDFTCANLYHIGGSVDFIGDDNVFRDNTIYVCGASETITPGPSNIIERNEAWSTAHLQNDGAIVQLMTSPAVGSVTRYNWFHDNKRSGFRTDGSLDVGNTGVSGYWEPWQKQTKTRLYGNVVWNCPTGFMVKGDYHIIANNTVFNNDVVDIVMMNPKPDGANHNSICRNNLAGMISGYRGGKTPDEYPLPPLCDHNWNGYYEGGEVEDLLMDAEGRDFRPKDVVPIVDAGSEDINTDIIISHDYTGTTYDIGAVEYNTNNYIIPGHRGRKCTNPIPADKSKSEVSTIMLACKPAYQATMFHVYFGESKSLVEGADQTSQEYKGSLMYSTYYPQDLDDNNVYYWRMDAVTSDEIIKGDVWEFTVGSGTGIFNQPKKRDLLKIYPTVSRNKVTITNIPMQANYSIFNSNGVKILESSFENTVESLFISHLPSGVYYIALEDPLILPVRFIKI